MEGVYGHNYTLVVPSPHDRKLRIHDSQCCMYILRLNIAHVYLYWLKNYYYVNDVHEGVLFSTRRTTNRRSRYFIAYSCDCSLFLRFAVFSWSHCSSTIRKCTVEVYQRLPQQFVRSLSPSPLLRFFFSKQLICDSYELVRQF